MIRGLALYVAALFITTGCGSLPGSSGSGSDAATLNLTIQNPDSNASGAVKAISARDIAAGKGAIANASVSSCTLTGSGPGSISHAFGFSAGAAQASTELSVPVGQGWTFCIECGDTSLATNGIQGGFSGCTTADIGSGGNSVSLAPKFLNLIADDSDVCQSIRFNQETAAQTKLTILFGSLLSAAEKTTATAYIELDSTGTRTHFGTLDVNTGLVSGTKSGKYIIFRGGLTKPTAFLYNTSDTRIMQFNCSWDAGVTNKTQGICTFGITQFKNVLDSDEKGQWAALCSLSGDPPFDKLPNSGYAHYDLSPNTSVESDVSALAENSAACSASRNGETCTSGLCGSSGLCAAVGATVAGTVTNFSGPSEGDTVAGFSNAGTIRYDTPFGACITPDGTQLFVPDFNNESVRQITVASGAVDTFVGTPGTVGNADGTGPAAEFARPNYCTIDSTGTYMYVTDSTNSNIRKVVIATGVTTTLAGPANGPAATGTTDGTGTNARFNSPMGIAIDSTDTNLYVADFNNHTIRKIVISSGAVTTLAGTAGVAGGTDDVGTAARFSNPRGLALDAADTYLFVADSGNHNVRKVRLDNGTVSRLAGTGSSGTTDGTGSDASFASPLGAAFDPSHTFLFISQGGGNGYIRKIQDMELGIVTTFAGTAGTGDTNGTGTNASFNGATHILFNPQGSVMYVIDNGNHKIRKIQ